jgi:CheY-like chemotaxis protein
MTWTLLLVEDDPDIREGLGDVLLARGFRVLLARDGHDAIAVARRMNSRPAVIVLDMMMPDMDGFEFLQHQRTDPILHDVPVIVLTAMEPLPRDLPSNVTAIFQKPLPLPEVLEEIRQIVSVGSKRGR